MQRMSLELCVYCTKERKTIWVFLYLAQSSVALLPLLPGVVWTNRYQAGLDTASCPDKNQYYMINRTAALKERGMCIYSQENILTHLCSTYCMLLMLGFVSLETSNWDFCFVFTGLAIFGRQFVIRDIVYRLREHSYCVYTNKYCKLLGLFTLQSETASADELMARLYTFQERFALVWSHGSKVH